MKQFTTIGCMAAFLLGISSVQAQISFTDRTEELSDPTHFSGVAVTVQDMNGDGLDDIVILDDARNLYIEYQGMDGVWTGLSGGEMDDGNAWGMAAGDVTSNGYGDVISGLFGGRPDYARANGTGTAFTISELPIYSLATQCVNLADMDNDGDLDFFSCGDTGPSGIWENDGSGNFSYSGDDIIQMTPTANPGWGSWDGSGNYGSTFTDFDLDGDLDLYISHCRQGVSNPADPRRINQLFINDGNNNYTEDFSNANGLRIGAQSWTTDFQDMDNDGDFDAFITNHDVDNMLLENVDGVFTDIFENSGLDMTVGTPIQGLMRDFNNDTYVDVIVTGSGSTSYALYLNNGDKTFTHVPGVFGNSSLYSLAVGDLNHDGFTDIYGSYATLYTNPSSTPDKLWINDGNDNNWITVELEGTVSNRSAIGTVVRAYGDWGIQVREVRSGESYGICNSLMPHFGLAQHTEIDSVVIDWPSGIHQVVENPSVNQFISVVEDECVAPETFITAQGANVLCAGESLTLNAPQGAYSYEWSTGEAASSIDVTEAGTYMVRVTDNSTGCSAVSASFEVVVSPDETPTITALGDPTFCEGESVVLRSSEASGYTWSTGWDGQDLEVFEPMAVAVTIPGQCGDFTSETFEVDMLEAPAPSADDVYIPIAGTTDLTASGTADEYLWYDQPTGGTSIGTGASLTTPMVNSTTSFYVEGVHEYPGDVFYGGKIDRTVNGGSHHNPSSFFLFFDVLEEMTLLSVKVYADGAGDRTFFIQDADDNIIHSETVSVPDGESRVEFNGWTLQPGADYGFRVEQTNLGLWRDNSSQVNFPYDLGGLATITGANTSSNTYYYYAYDWEVQATDRTCVSQREEVVVTVGTVGVAESALSQVAIYPNPSKSDVQVDIPGQVEGIIELELLDLSGRSLQTRTVTSGVHSLDVSTLASGVYVIRLLNEQSGAVQFRIVVQ